MPQRNIPQPMPPQITVAIGHIILDSIAEPIIDRLSQPILVGLIMKYMNAILLDVKLIAWIS